MKEIEELVEEDKELDLEMAKYKLKYMTTFFPISVLTIDLKKFSESKKKNLNTTDPTNTTGDTSDTTGTTNVANVTLLLTTTPLSWLDLSFMLGSMLLLGYAVHLFIQKKIHCL